MLTLRQEAKYERQMQLEKNDKGGSEHVVAEITVMLAVSLNAAKSVELH
jgi:hypothetical protein